MPRHAKPAFDPLAKTVSRQVRTLQAQPPHGASAAMRGLIRQTLRLATLLRAPLALCTVAIATVTCYMRMSNGYNSLYRPGFSRLFEISSVSNIGQKIQDTFSTFYITLQ